MPARDIYHNAVKNALIKDGWKITHDPLRLEWGGRDLYIDLGAEELFAAEKENRQIAVEIKSFIGASDMADLEKALGQYVLYHDVLAETEPTRKLYLAIPRKALVDIFQEPIGKLLLKNNRVQLFSFDPHTEEIVQWTL